MKMHRAFTVKVHRSLREQADRELDFAPGCPNCFVPPSITEAFRELLPKGWSGYYSPSTGEFTAWWTIDENPLARGITVPVKIKVTTEIVPAVEPTPFIAILEELQRIRGLICDARGVSR